MDSQSSMDMITAVDEARIALYKDHCMEAENPAYAVSQLAGQFLHQACVCLLALYGGNQSMMLAHLMLLLCSLNEEVEELPEPVLVGG